MIRSVVAMLAARAPALPVRTARDTGERSPGFKAIPFRCLSLNPTTHVEKMPGALKTRFDDR